MKIPGEQGRIVSRRVYLTGPALDEGESLRAILARRAPPPGFANVYPDQYGFLWFDTGKFRETFCLDLDETESLELALRQKPTAMRCFEDKSGPPAQRAKRISTRQPRKVHRGSCYRR